MVGVVTAYNAWAVYRACRDRYFPASNTTASAENSDARRPN
jgi:hypothetical protein